MKKKAIISLISKQDNEDGNIEVVTPGDFYKKDDCYYAVYNETQITGMQDTTTTLKINKDKFCLIRMGSTNTNMNFTTNGKDIALYDTPYGTMELKIFTKNIDINVNDEGGKVMIDYTMSIEGYKPQNTVLEINIKAN